MLKHLSQSDAWCFIFFELLSATANMMSQISAVAPMWAHPGFEVENMFFMIVHYLCLSNILMPFYGIFLFTDRSRKLESKRLMMCAKSNETLSRSGFQTTVKDSRKHQHTHIHLYVGIPTLTLFLFSFWQLSIIFSRAAEQEEEEKRTIMHTYKSDWSQVAMLFMA